MGWGGVGGCNNVHVTCVACDATLMVRTMMWGGVGWGGVGWGGVGGWGQAAARNVIRRNAAKFVSASHNKSQFTKKICKKNGVRLAGTGTQQIDRTLYQVKKYPEVIEQ